MAAVCAAAGWHALTENPLPMRLPASFYEIDSGARPLLIAGARRLYEEASAVFLDARDEEEFALGQIDGALNVPAARWSEFYQDLLPWIEGQRIVVYAAARDVGAADDLAGALMSRGTPRDSVSIYLGGYEEWRTEGLAVREGAGSLGEFGTDGSPEEDVEP